MNPYRSILILTVFSILLAPTVLAGENKVPHDGTVYVGEADIDISDCEVRNGDEIAWWESGNPQGTPTARARVDDVRRFTVDPETFKGHSGTWFGLIGKKIVFKVEEPFLKVELVENGIDREPSAIKRGSLVSFKISTNLAALSQRPGSPGATVALNLSGPNGTEYHTLSSSRTEDFNLDAVYVYTTPYDTGAVWDTTDKKKFPDGEYTLSASTKVNRINEIYPDSGISYTEKLTYTLGEKEVKPTPTKTIKPEKKSDSEKDELSEEKSGKVTPTETPDDEKSDGKSSKKKVTEEPTEEPTEEITTAPTTEEPTPEPTEEPTEKVTPRPTRKPLPHPPSATGPSPTQTKASPINPVVIVSALGMGALAVVSRRK